MYLWILFILIIVYLLIKLFIIIEDEDEAFTDLSGEDVSGVDLSLENASVNTLPISSILSNMEISQDSYNAIATEAVKDLSNNSSIFDTGSQSFKIDGIDISSLNFNDGSIEKAKSIFDSIIDTAKLDRRSITDLSYNIDTLRNHKENYINAEEQYRLRGDWSKLLSTRQIVDGIDNHIKSNLT